VGLKGLVTGWISVGGDPDRGARAGLRGLRRVCRARSRTQRGLCQAEEERRAALGLCARIANSALEPDRLVWRSAHRH
jgi:hypothetical protein